MDLSNPLFKLLAMFTPAVLMLACGLLISPATRKLLKMMDRIRQLAERFKDFSMDEKVSQEEQDSFYKLLDQSTQSAKLLQRSLNGLYLAIIFLVSAIIAIALMMLTGPLRVAPGLLGLMGAGCLFYAGILLMLESRISFNSIYLETEFLLQMQKQYAPKEIAKSSWFKSRRKFFKSVLPS
jgi:hypothetical protein